jgi:hypothetical protein
MGPSANTNEDGKFRICDLHRGEYLLTIFVADAEGTPTMLAQSQAQITDGDIHDLKLTPRLRVPISGEVCWDGPAPTQAVQGEIHIAMEPLSRPGFKGEWQGLEAKSSIPGTFSFPGPYVDEYRARVYGVPTGFYLKEASFAGTNMLNAPVVPGSRGDNSMRIVLGRDGGTIQLKTVDKDGKAVPDTTLILGPAEIGSPMLLAGALVHASSDQNGTYTSETQTPGKYS